MLLKLLRRALVCLLALPQAVLALGLGDIHLNSTLNAPLDAEIELVDATAEELSTLEPRLASREMFTRYGLEYPGFLSTVTIERASPTSDVLRVRSSATITEPFVTLLVEVNWARGRLVREYTVLLDPPVFAPNAANTPAAPVSAPADSGATRAGDIDRAPATQAPAASTPRQAPAAAPAPARAGGTYSVERGDTLSSIARRLSSDGAADANRLMVGLYQANADAFDGNMNDLRAGAVLRVPDAAALAAISAGNAAAEIRRQYAAWDGRDGAAGAATGGGERLRLLPASEAGAGTGGSGDVSALQDRVRALESELAESRRLLELRNAELAELQGRLSGAAPAAEPQAPVTGAAEDVPASEVTPPAAVAQAEGEGIAEDDTTAASEAPAVEPAAEAAPASEPVAGTPAAESAAQPRDGGGLMGLLRSLWYIPVLLLVLLAGLFGYRKWREKQAEEFDDSLSRLAEASSDSMETRGLTDTARLRKPMPLADDEAFLVEESGSHERPHILEGTVARPAAAVVTNDEPLPGDTGSINLDQGDPLAEADFHMAYGLYDQAADLIRIAIEREPARRDLKLKLLEVFFVWGNKDEFLGTARQLASTRDEAPAGEWEKIVIMGRQLAPDDELFADAGSMGGAVAGGVDLDLEGGQNRVDYDLLGGDLAEPPRQGVDLDFNTALGDDELADAAIGDQDQTGEAPTVESGDLDFVLDDPDRGGDIADDDGGATTREMTAEMTQRMPGDAPELDDLYAPEAGEAPTVEQPVLRPDDNATIREKLGSAFHQDDFGGDQTAEVALDDLGLDLDGPGGDADTNDSDADADAPTMVAGLDERSREIMADAERRATGEQDADADDETGSGLPDLSDLPDWPAETDEAAAETGQNPALVDPNATASLQALPEAADAGETSRLAALSGEDIDIDFGATDFAGEPSGEAASELDLDVGSPEPEEGEGEFAATQRVNAEDLALPDLEPVTMSEVGTKLDLARAYMDMGDPDGARSILNEVLQEGSVSQKQEAQRLVDALPG